MLNNSSNFEPLIIGKTIFAVTTRLRECFDKFVRFDKFQVRYYLHNPEISGYQRHYVESVDRQVVHLSLGYFSLFISQF